MNKVIISIIAVVVITTLFSTNMAYATSHNASIFSGALRYANSNSYKNSNYSISIQPPINWTVLTNLPPNVSNQAIVIFSNNDKTQLATFGIYHRYIAPNVIEAIDSHSDNDVLATIAQEMTHQDNDSKTIVYNGVVDRYTDGVRVAISSATNYVADNSTSLSENIIYFLDNGNQYTLDLTSNPDNIDKNSQLFEDSANTFVASQTNPVPEFPISLAILIIGMLSAIFIFRIKNITGTMDYA
ncbi:MAG: hypothetical protein KGH86_05680 [Thaumarchaeota archaeon]|nr:hypothetical protein [Nitrososphaerota archaeon]MDE1817960.1 hypothetical protein [Nitrososphaerota archaeon]MDE1876298.1 hypothetical protein [Nitrososphaerota archaeon]